VTLQNVVGAGLWLPFMPGGALYANARAASDSLLLDADQKEAQFIGTVHIVGGGSKTFGIGGSALDWLPGASITFAANSTLTVGVKKASTIDSANGPAARATIGAAAFDVSKALVGGTDTITSLTWRSDAMASGTPYTVTDGDLLALCFHLATTSGAPSIKVRGALTNVTVGQATATLVTAGPTYTAQGMLPNAILTFDDGTLGWLEPTSAFAVVDAASGNVGNTNINGNIFQVPYACKIDALAAVVNPSTNAANFDLSLWNTPLGTPSLVEAITFDANVTPTVGNNRLYMKRLTTPRTLTINTDYAIGVRQTTATAVTVPQYDVSVAAHFKPNGMGAECYAAISTAAATFAAQNSGKRRYLVWCRISALDDGVSAGGGLFRSPGLTGGVLG
jgi:hypothetical protein